MFWFITHTRHEKLNLSYSDNFLISCFRDADFESNENDCTLIGGFIIYLNDASISWRTSKHCNVML